MTMASFHRHARLIGVGKELWAALSEQLVDRELLCAARTQCNDVQAKGYPYCGSHAARIKGQLLSRQRTLSSYPDDVRLGTFEVNIAAEGPQLGD